METSEQKRQREALERQREDQAAQDSCERAGRGLLERNR